MNLLIITIWIQNKNHNTKRKTYLWVSKGAHFTAPGLCAAMVTMPIAKSYGFLTKDSAKDEGAVKTITPSKV